MHLPTLCPELVPRPLRAFLCVLVVLGDFDDAEEVAIGVFEDHKVGARSVSPRIWPCTQRGETRHFVRLIRRIEIQVDPAAFALAPLACLIPLCATAAMSVFSFFYPTLWLKLAATITGIEF